MISKAMKIKTAMHHLNEIAFPCDEMPRDFILDTDYQFGTFTGHSHRYNAIVEIRYDTLGKPSQIEVTFLGEEVEPEEEQEAIQEDTITRMFKPLLGKEEQERLSSAITSLGTREL